VKSSCIGVEQCWKFNDSVLTWNNYKPVVLIFNKELLDGAFVVYIIIDVQGCFVTIEQI
jgi:hypothetical protein